jgi:hypothetical protein
LYKDLAFYIRHAARVKYTTLRNLAVFPSSGKSNSFKPILLGQFYRDILRLKNRLRALIITGEIKALFWDDEISEESVASILRVKAKLL